MEHGTAACSANAAKFLYVSITTTTCGHTLLQFLSPTTSHLTSSAARRAVTEQWVLRRWLSQQCRETTSGARADEPAGSEEWPR